MQMPVRPEILGRFFLRISDDMTKINNFYTGKQEMGKQNSQEKGLAVSLSGES